MDAREPLQLPSSPRGLAILQHSLGLDRYGKGPRIWHGPSDRPMDAGATRNHFVAGGDDVAACRELVAAGLMIERPASELTGGCPLFHVADAGKAYVREHSPALPKLTRSQQRYREFLDADSGLSFLEWLKATAGMGRA